VVVLRAAEQTAALLLLLLLLALLCRAEEVARLGRLRVAKQRSCRLLCRRRAASMQLAFVRRHELPLLTTTPASAPATAGQDRRIVLPIGKAVPASGSVCFPACPQTDPHSAGAATAPSTSQRDPHSVRRTQPACSRSRRAPTTVVGLRYFAPLRRARRPAGVAVRMRRRRRDLRQSAAAWWSIRRGRRWTGAGMLHWWRSRGRRPGWRCCFRRCRHVSLIDCRCSTVMVPGHGHGCGCV
jgi:hypothetical protein